MQLYRLGSRTDACTLAQAISILVWAQGLFVWYRACLFIATIRHRMRITLGLPGTGLITRVTKVLLARSY